MKLASHVDQDAKNVKRKYYFIYSIISSNATTSTVCFSAQNRELSGNFCVCKTNYSEPGAGDICE